MKYTFLFYQIGGDFEGIAMRVKAEGYPVFIHKNRGQIKGREDTGVGMFDPKEMITDIHQVLSEFKEKKDELIIICDDNSVGDQMDLLRFEGWKIIGGTRETDEWEYDRAKGLDIMNQIGLDTPYEKDFESIDDALEYLDTEDDDARYVFKPHGDEFAGSSRTYTGKNKQDLIDYLKWTKMDILEKHTDIQKFVLQEFIEGIEADFGFYKTASGIMEGLVLLDVEEKKSGDGNKGEATGCMGNIILNIGKSKYFEKYLKPFDQLLSETGYIGEFSINNIFSSKDQGKHKQYKAGEPYGLEFTPRFGWDAHTTEMAILKDSQLKISDFYISLIEGKSFKFPIGKVGCGIRIYTGSVGSKRDDVCGKYFSFDRSIAKRLWFYSASYKKRSFVIEDNPVLVVNTVGKSLHDTIQECYDTIKESLNVPDIYYRMEIGKRAEEVIRFLKDYNWIGKGGDNNDKTEKDDETSQ